MENKFVLWTNFLEKVMRKFVTAAVILPVDQCPLPRLNCSLMTQESAAWLSTDTH